MLEAQGGLPPGPRVLYVRGTRTSLGRTVRAVHRGTPGDSRQLLVVEKEVRYQLKNPSKPVAGVVLKTYTDRLVAKVPIVTLKGSHPVIDLRALLGGQA